MAIFIYKARNNSGIPVSGEMESKNASDVKKALAAQGLFPVSVSSKGMELKLPSFFQREKKVKPKDLITITRQFAALFKAGVPMDRILTTLIKQAPRQDMKEVLQKIYDDVAGGTALAQAFARHPAYFDELYVNMLNVGEQSGMLDETLKELIKIIQNDHKIVSNVKSATLYPKIVITVFIAVFILMVTYVIPRFADFYSGFNAQLPLPTRIMLGISDFFQNYWFVLLGAVVIGFLSLRKYKRTAIGKMTLDKLKFRYPVFGKLNLMVANARFARLIAALYKSGLPLSQALTITGKTIGSISYQKEVDAVREEVDKGSTLAGAMENKRYFTPLIIESTAVGEQSGALDDLLDSAANFYDDEIAVMLDQLTTLIEPLLLFGLFGMVALLAFAIFLPMWNVTKVVLTH